MLTYFFGIISTLLFLAIIKLINQKVTKYEPLIQWVQVPLPKNQYDAFRELLDEHEDNAPLEFPVDVNKLKHPRLLDVVFTALWRFFAR